MWTAADLCDSLVHLCKLAVRGSHSPSDDVYVMLTQKNKFPFNPFRQIWMTSGLFVSTSEIFCFVSVKLLQH